MFLTKIWRKTAVRQVFRYSLPFLTVLAALVSQGILQHLVPKEIDFPYAFFYLIAAFVSAWYGGYVAGALACAFTMVGLPLMMVHFSQLPPVDFSRLVIFIGVSLLVSRVAKTQRRAREVLRRSNDELDRRVQARTGELAHVVEQLESEIAEHRKTEAALRDSEERVAFALEAAGFGHWELDLVTGRMQRSLRHDQIFGYEALQPEWSFDRLLDHLLPEDRRQVGAGFESATRGESIWDVDCRIRARDHSVRWIWYRGKIRRDQSGGAVGIAGIVGDITDRKLAEEKLRAQIGRLSLLDQITRAIGDRQDLHSIFQVVVRTLEDSLPVDFGSVCLYDASAQSLTVTCVGVRSASLAMDLAMSPQSRFAIDANGLSRCVRGQLVYEQDVSEIHFPFPQRLANGGLRAMVAAPLQAENQVFGVLIAARREPHSFSSGDCEFLRQVSEHVALAAHAAGVRGALQRAYDDLRQTQQTVMQQERLRALGQMASGIAHDINNALSPMALYTESLLEREPNLSPRTREYLETAQRSIDDVTHTVGRMREFSRQREAELMLMPVDLNRLARQVIDLTRARWCDIPQKQGIVIQMQTELAPDLPSTVGIESEIREALINLVFNAVDAMPHGGTVTVRTRSTSENGNRRLYLEVKDTGIGMDEQTRRRCLEPFFTTKGDRGTGLGLAMVYGVAQRMSAEIEIESAIGQGTLVRLSFAVRAAALRISTPTHLTPAPRGLRILVVDDDPLIIKSLRETLEADGHSVTAAYGGQEGIDAWQAAERRQEPFAIVLTDLGMPHVDGRKVATAVKATCPTVPVILLTGWGQRMAEEMPSHVDRVLNKPPKLSELRVAFSELFAGTNGSAPAILEPVQ